MERSAAKLVWEKPKMRAMHGDAANLPRARSGHSLSIVGNTGFLFGGLADGGEAASALSEMHVVRFGKAEMEWSHLALPASASPLPRWRHTACLHEGGIVVFGGYHTSSLRLNDVWVFNTVSVSWEQPHPPGGLETGKDASNCGAWPNLPQPRGGHSAAVCGGGMYVFGGYGGAGYARRDLDDLHRLDFADWTWASPRTKGRGPEKRSGHGSIAVDDNVFVFGGWNAAEQFGDLFILDVSRDPAVWSAFDGSLAAPNWHFSTCQVLAIPSCKVFAFGGCLGPLNETTNKLGRLDGGIRVLDVCTNRWTVHQVAGDGPTPRCDSVLAYDAPCSRLVLFGGWGDAWLGDTLTLDVSGVVGPPYAISSVEPNAGPVTGHTPLSITGVDFVNSKNVLLRFAGKHGAVDVLGEFVSASLLRCKSPDFSTYGAGEVHVRVALKGDSFTTTAQSFVFFPVTSAATTLIFGPGLLHGGLAGEAATFVIRARDANNENRQTGNDDFTVVIHHGDRVLRNVSVRDRDDGSYLVSFSPDAPGKYTIAVVFNGTFGGLAGAVRGSGADVVFESSGARANNTFTGKLLATQIRHDLRLVEDWLESTLAAISAPFHKSDWSDSENRAALVSVKLGLVEVAEGTAANGLILDRLACTLAFLKSQGSNVGPQLALLDKHRSVYEQVLSQAPPAELRIAPYMKDQASRTASDMADHEARCRAFSEKVARAPFQTRDGASLEAMVAEYTVEEGKLEEMMHLAALFDCRDQMCQSVELCADAGRVLGAFSAFWSLAGECREYMRQAGEVHFRDLDAAGLVDNGDFVRHKVMAMPPAVLKSEAQAQLVKTAVHFQSACHLVASLKRAALRERHWAALSASVEQDVRSMALSEILALDLPASFVTQVCDGALREAARESALKSVEAFWAAAVFDTTYYKQTDVPLLALAESDAAQLAHDQLALRTAAHKTTFLKTELEEWQTSLATVAATAAMLTAVQRTWTCLEPLFGAPEVKAELPVASSHFKSAHARLRSVLRSLAHSKNVIRACSQSGVGEQLDSLHADLESLKRALADFVNAKRDTFPRFYFIAEADLLDMLSTGSNPARVQIYKVLPQTAKLEVDDAVGAVGFVSKAGTERVKFEDAVPISGNVAAFLHSVVSAQTWTLKCQLKRSMARYPKQTRLDWFCAQKEDRAEDAAQIALLVAAAFSVAETEAVLEADDPGAFVRYAARQSHDLTHLVQMAQAPSHASQRMRLTNLILSDSHRRDVFAKLGQGQTKTGFFWKAQLKPYLARDAAGHVSPEVRVCEASFLYGFEYVGDAPRLVVTPLTDRFFVSATRALQLGLGLATFGRSGKAASVEDLAANLGQCCYAFTCSAATELCGLGRIFKGLAASGAWVILRDFDRLQPEKLALCAGLLSALLAKKDLLARKESAHLDGQAVVDPRCAFFATLRSSHAVLPEAFKALCRPVAMAKPDCLKICQAVLFSEGFLKADSLGRKLDAFVQLRTEGAGDVRGAKHACLTAGALKRRDPAQDEEFCVLHAVRDVFLPKMHHEEDRQGAEATLLDLFPNVVFLEPRVAKSISNAAQAAGLWPDPVFLSRVEQLGVLMESRHCVFVLGAAGSGKSTTWKTLQQSFNSHEQKVRFHALNPKVHSTAMLYGSLDAETNAWRDGLLTKLLRGAEDKMKWIVLDGDVDARWIESLHSVMDEPRTLTLASNERVALGPHVKLVLESRDVRFATPAAVSRCGVLYVASDVPWSLVGAWVLKVGRPGSGFPEDAGAVFSSLFEKYVRLTLAYLRLDCAAAVPLEDMEGVSTLLRLLDCSFKPAALDDAVFETQFVFCCIWAFGAALLEHGHRAKFSDWWHKTFQTVKLPPRGTIFDYWLDVASNTFEPWSSAPSFQMGNASNMHDTTVPTKETASVSHWLHLLVSAGHPALVAGPAGAGKTLMVQSLRLAPARRFAKVDLNYYSCAHLGRTHLSRAWRTAAGSGTVVFFVDDLNLPRKDDFETQPALEVFRHHLDYGEWDDSGQAVKRFSDSQYVACLDPDRGAINPRLRRHFSTLALGAPCAASVKTIFEALFRAGGVSSGASEAMVESSVDLHLRVSAQFRPDPGHGGFNLAHLVRLCRSLATFAKKHDVLLWAHEAERTYGDALARADRVAHFRTTLAETAKVHFPNAPDDVFGEHAKPLVFCGLGEYGLADDLDSLSRTFSSALAGTGLEDFCFFHDAVCHVARALRVIQHGGPLILVGGPGCGKKSVAEMAAVLAGQTVRRVSKNADTEHAFQKELQDVIKAAKNGPTTLLVADSDVADERSWVPLEACVKGDLDSLLSPDERTTDGAFPEGLHLRVVLCLSPDGLRRSNARFPSLLKCAQVSCFLAWPVDALERVARKVLGPLDFKSAGVRSNVAKFAASCFGTLGTGVAQSAYLGMLHVFASTLVHKRNSHAYKLSRLEHGLLQLQSANRAVLTLDADLDALDADAAEKRSGAERTLERVSSSKSARDDQMAERDETEARVENLEAEVTRQTELAAAHLASAQPCMSKASAALDTLDKAHLQAARSLAPAPPGVLAAFSAVAVLLAGVSPNVRLHRDGTVHDFKWAALQQQLLSNVNGFVDDLTGFRSKMDSGTIPPLNFTRVRPYLAMACFNEEVVSKKSIAAACLVAWVVHTVAYYDVWVQVEPLRFKVVESTALLDAARVDLVSVQAAFLAAQAHLDSDTTEYESAEAASVLASETADRGRLKVEVCKRLVCALGASESAWAAEVEARVSANDSAVGESLFQAAFLSFCGPLDSAGRRALLDRWAASLEAGGIPKRPNSGLISARKRARWRAEGLARGMADNGALALYAPRWPLLVDPHSMCLGWLRRRFSESVTLVHAAEFGPALRRCMAAGSVLLVEHAAGALPGLRASDFPEKDRRRDDATFDLLLHTTSATPAVPPALLAKVCIVNCAISEKGLEEELLDVALCATRPRLAYERHRALRAQDQLRLHICKSESDILAKLASDGATEDGALITEVERIHLSAVEAKRELEASRAEAAGMELTAESYRELARRGASLFFLMTKLQRVHPLYVYSLHAFAAMFQRGIDQAPPNVESLISTRRFRWDRCPFAPPGAPEDDAPEEADLTAERLRSYASSVTRFFLDLVLQGTFARDERTVLSLFAVAACSETLGLCEVLALLSPRDAGEPRAMTPEVGAWLPPETWRRLANLETAAKKAAFAALADVCDQVDCASEKWAAYFEEPQARQLPGALQDLNALERLALLLALRPDRAVFGLGRLVSQVLGDVDECDLDRTFSRACASMPVLFVGACEALETSVARLAASKGLSLCVVRMAAGAEEQAGQTLDKMAAEGGMVFLRHVHLVPTWLGELESKLGGFASEGHANFRCFVSIAHDADAQCALFTACIKVADQRRYDWRSNLRRAWAALDRTALAAARSSLFRLCLFHAFVLGRRSFGRVGFSQDYAWGDADLHLGARAVAAHFSKAGPQPAQDLTSPVGDVYGGHVCDFWDARAANNGLAALYTADVTGADVAGFHAPDPKLDWAGVAEHIEHVPPSNSPELYGLHANSEMASVSDSANRVLAALADVPPTVTSATACDVGGLVASLASRVAPPFAFGDSVVAGPRAPYVLLARREMREMNALLYEISTSLDHLGQGLSGTVRTTAAMDSLAASLRSNLVPGRGTLGMGADWARYYFSNKALGAWFDDLQGRVEQLKAWQSEKPKVMRLSYLFHPRAFLAAVAQVKSREHATPLEKTTVRMSVTTALLAADVPATTHDGAFANGLFLQGARWIPADTSAEAGLPLRLVGGGAAATGCLAESIPGEALPQMPVIYLEAVVVDACWEASSVGFLDPSPNVYNCPVYATAARGNTYVFLATLATQAPSSKWIAAGVALLLQSDE